MHEVRIRLGVLLVLSNACISGCTGGGQQSNAQVDLMSICSAYNSYSRENAPKAPSNAEDLRLAYQKDVPIGREGTVQVFPPTAYQGLKDGKYVFLYGVPLRDIITSVPGTAGTILAYEKDVPTTGGYVVMADGTPRQMTAAEFQSTPKAAARKQ